MEIDYRRWDPGVALAAHIILVTCPVCGRSADKKATRKGERYVHRVCVERRTSAAKRFYTRLVELAVCRVSPAGRRTHRARS